MLLWYFLAGEHFCVAAGNSIDTEWSSKGSKWCPCLQCQLNTEPRHRPMLFDSYACTCAYGQAISYIYLHIRYCNDMFLRQGMTALAWAPFIKWKHLLTKQTVHIGTRKLPNLDIPFRHMSTQLFGTVPEKTIRCFVPLRHFLVLEKMPFFENVHFQFGDACFVSLFSMRSLNKKRCCWRLLFAKPMLKKWKSRRAAMLRLRHDIPKAVDSAWLDETCVL